jgi:hypothetical protein
MKFNYACYVMGICLPSSVENLPIPDVIEGNNARIGEKAVCAQGVIFALGERAGVDGVD